MATYHIIVKGKVQGVFYRATARDIAQEKKLTGWVRNTAEENVEIMVSGNNHQVQEFIEWCRKGPRKAIVTELNITEVNDESFADFSIKR